MTIETLLQEQSAVKTPESFKRNALFQDPSIYKEDRLKFWEARANDLAWFKPWDRVLEWNRPYAKWFCNGKLNASYNCLDVHLKTHRKNKAAIIWEGENGETKTLTYNQLYLEVNKLSYVLKNTYHIKKGDRVTIYMPMVPDAAVAVLACARIGAIHSVVFGGFSAQSLKDRLHDSDSKLLITAEQGYRRGQIVPLRKIAEETGFKTILVLPIQAKQEFVEAEVMDSEDPLFILYTSGTTGKPKGIVHTTGGYMTHAKFSTRAVFDLKDDDIFWCTADIGWITGHTYVVYGPLSNGATVMMFEGTPDYPDKDRFWDVIEKHRVTILYTAPTAIRSFMKWGTEHVEKHDLSSLRLLGTVGEPINPEAWMWYHKHIGGERCPIVDTWWQTETGGIMICNLPGIHDSKPGCAGIPLPGIEANVVDGLLTLTQPWPSMLRGIWGDNKRYEEVYWSRFETYFAGDGATVDQDGYFMVLGRVDDVLNVAGHRIGTMEMESTLVEFPGVAEAAVVGMPDEIKGQAILAFVILKEGAQADEQAMIRFVGEKIGAIAKPKKIIFTPELPKTRSGKIMRRLLKDLAEGKTGGDTTTLANPDIVEALRGRV